MSMPRRALFGLFAGAPLAALVAAPKVQAAPTTVTVEIDAESVRAVVRDEADRVIGIVRQYSGKAVGDWRIP